MASTRNFDDKITYYFGAGASANAIPTVNGLMERLEDFGVFLSDMGNSIANNSYGSQRLADWTELGQFYGHWSNAIKGVPSLDTLAKRFYDQGKMDVYYEYKVFLVVLFNYLHKFKRLVSKSIRYTPNSLEGRYENLIRSINLFDGTANISKPIPDNFTFITWNYDFHLELTAFNDLQIDCGFYDAMHAKKDFLGLNIINLNGSSLVSNIYYEEKDPFSLLIEIFKYLKEDPEKNPLKFAWEFKEENVNFLNNVAKESKYVVVIGYSFPSFNRDIDNSFFHKLNPGTKIFTQGYNYSDSVSIERYLRQTSPEINKHITITPVESPFFYVPAEYFLEKEKPLYTGITSFDLN